MNQGSKGASVVLGTLGCVLALALGWLLLGEDETAPILENDTQPLVRVDEPRGVSSLASSETQSESTSPERIVPVRTAVEELASASFVALEGRVLSRESGEPVEGALVKWLGARGQELGSSHSNVDGTFVSSVPAEAVQRLLVEKEGFEPIARTVKAPTDFLELRLESSCELVVHMSVLGTRDWDEVEYQLWLPRVKSPEAGPVATKSGDATLTEVRFKDLVAGTYELVAHVRDCGWAYRGSLTLRAGESLVVPLEVVAGVSLSGRVTLEETQERVAGAVLSLRPKRQGIGKRILSKVNLSAVTDADGHYSVQGVTPGEHVVLVQHSGLIHKESIDLPKSGAVEVRDFELPPVASLAGQVRDRSGKGVSGIEVLAYVPKSKARSERAYPGSWRINAESDGRFEFPALPYGVDLYVEACFESDRGNPEANFIGESLRLRKGERRENYLVVMHPMREVIGVVFSEAGEPIADAQLQVFAEATGSQRLARDVADESGQFRTRVFTPSPSLVVSASGYSSRRVAVEPMDGTDRVPLRVELRSISPLKGLVIDPDGNGVPSARVEIVRPEVPGETKRSQRGGRRARTDEFGRFSVGGLAEGRWVVTAANGGWIKGENSSVEIELPSDEVVTLELTRDESLSELPATVRGAVRFKDGGVPVGIRFDKLRGGTPVIDGDRFELTGVRPGRVAFEVEADGALERRLEPLELAPGGVYDLGTIELEHATDLRVSVRGPSGETLDQARVFLRATPAERNEGSAEKRIRIRKDPRRARYRRVRTPRGEFQLLVLHEGYKPYRRILRVGVESPQSVQVEMTAPN